jgi:hypothetical protein
MSTLNAAESPRIWPEPGVFQRTHSLFQALAKASEAKIAKVFTFVSTVLLKFALLSADQKDKDVVTDNRLLPA